MTYVRAWLEPREVSQDGEAKCTAKRGIQYTPWYGILIQRFVGVWNVTFDGNLTRLR